MEYRTTEVLRDGAFVQTEFEALRTGDHFRLFEPDGKLVAEAVVLSDPQPCEPPGNWILEADKRAPV